MEPGAAGGDFDSGTGSEGSGRGKADRSSQPGDFGESFGPNEYSGFSDANKAIFDRLHREHVDSLGFGALAGRFGRAFSGQNPGAFGYSEWGHPVGTIMDVTQAALTASPLPGGNIMGRTAKGLSEISTGSNADFGGGFGTAEGGPGTGRDPSGVASIGGTTGLGQSIQQQAVDPMAPTGMPGAPGDPNDPMAGLTEEILAKLEIENPQLALIVRAKLGILKPVGAPKNVSPQEGEMPDTVARRMFGQPPQVASAGPGASTIGRTMFAPSGVA